MIYLGLGAEHLVCSDLIFQGYLAQLSPQMSPYDLVVDINGRLLRVQVKATQTKTLFTNENKIPRYRWQIKRSHKDYATGLKENYKTDDFDLLALVAVDIKQVAYVPMTKDLPTTIEIYHEFKGRRSTSRLMSECTLQRALSELFTRSVA